MRIRHIVGVEISRIWPKLHERNFFILYLGLELGHIGLAPTFTIYTHFETTIKYALSVQMNCIHYFLLRFLKLL